MMTFAAVLLALAASCVYGSAHAAYASQDSWVGLRTHIEVNDGMKGIQVALDNAAALLQQEVVVRAPSTFDQDLAV